jgi:hypothetical protein
VLNSINEPTEPLIQEKDTEKQTGSKDKVVPIDKVIPIDNVVPIDKAVKQSKKTQSKADKQEAKETEPQETKDSLLTKKLFAISILKNKATEPPYPNGEDKSEPNDDVWRDVYEKF